MAGRAHKENSPESPLNRLGKVSGLTERRIVQATTKPQLTDPRHGWGNDVLFNIPKLPAFVTGPNEDSQGPALIADDEC